MLGVGLAAPQAVSAQTASGDGSISGTVFRNGAPTSNQGSTVEALDATGATVATGQIDTDGNYTISAVPPGNYVIRLYDRALDNTPRFHPAANEIEQAASVDVGTGQDIADIDIFLRATATITGTVMGANGLPLEGVDVAAFEHPLMSTTRVTTTGASGTYSIVVPAVPTVLRFSASLLNSVFTGGTGFDDATPIATSPGQVLGDIDAVMPTGALIGTITDNTIPLANESVTVFLSPSQSVSVQTSATGEFAAPLLPAGDYTIRVFAPNGEGAVTFGPFASDGVTLSPALDLALPQGSIAGTIWNNGEPAPASPATFVQLIDGVTGAAVTSTNVGTDGSYRFGRVFDGAYRIRALNPGVLGTAWHPSGSTSSTAAIVNVIDAAQLENIDVAFGDNAIITGTVTDTGGAPVPQVWVLARDTDSSSVVGNWTDGNGRYTLAVEPNGTYAVAFRPPGGPELAYASTDGANVTVGGIGSQLGGIDAVLPTGSITVTVADGLDPAGGLWTRLSTYSEVGPQLSIDATTASDGTATYSYLPAGDYRIQVNPLGQNQSVLYGPFASDGVGNLAVDVTLPSGAISGTVTQPGATFTGDDEVFVYDLVNEIGRRTPISPSGTYELRNLPDGDYRVSIDRRGTGLTYYHPGVLTPEDAATVSIRDGIPAENIDITVTATGFISGSVTATDGTPLPDLLVRTVAPGTDPFGARTQSDGTYRFEATLGTYDVEVQFPEGPSLTFATGVALTTPAQELVGVDAVVPNGSITGVVTDNASAFANAQVLASKVENADERGTRTASDGSFEFRYLPAGDWVISTTLPTGRTIDLVTVTVDEATVDVGSFDVPNGSISGTVEHNGVPADGTEGRYTVTLLDGGTSVSAMPDENGNYSFAYLDDGEYRVEAQHVASRVVAQHPSAVPPATGALVTVTGEASVAGIDVALPDTGLISGAAVEKSGPAVDDVTVTATSTTPGYANSVPVAADGSYVIELPAGTYTIRFTSPRAGTRYWDARTPQEATELTIVDSSTSIPDIDATYPSGGFVGVVQDRGVGVEGRTIRASAIDGGASWSFITGAAGSFAFGYLEAGDYQVSIDMPTAGYVELGTFTTGDDGPLADLVLDVPIGEISGTIVREGVPLTATGGSVVVSLRRDDGQTVRTTAIADDGSFGFSYLSDGDYVVSSLDPIARQVTFHPAAPDLAAATVLTINGATTQLDADITFVDTGEISGTVRTTGGQPIAGAVVTASEPTGIRNHTTTTDATGTYELELAAGTYTVSFRPPDGPSRFWDGAATLESASTIEVVNSTSIFSDIDAAFSTGRIAGTLRDAGELASNRQLTLRSSTAEDVTAFTNVDGQFDFRYLGAGTYQLRGSAPVPEGDVLLDTFTIGDDGELIDLEVHYPTGAVEGAISRNGALLAGASGSPVTLTPTTGGETRIATLASGQYTARYLPAGDYLVSFNDPVGGATRYHPGVASDSEATIVTVGTGTVGNVGIALADTATVSGTITSPSGPAVQGAVVSAQPLGGGAFASTTTDSTGNYVLELAIGTYRISVAAPTGGYSAYLSSDPSGTTRMEDARTFSIVDRTSGVTGGDLELPTGGFAGTITVGASTGSQLVARVADVVTGASFTTRSGDDGAFTFEYLPAGTYDLSVTVPDQTGETARLRVVTDGITVTQGIIVDVPVGTISGRIVRNDSAIDGSRTFGSVTLTAMGGSLQRRATVGSDGSYSASYLPDGSYLVTFLDPIAQELVYHPGELDAGTATPVVVVNGSHERDTDVTLAETGFIAGTATDSNGEPVAGVIVSAIGNGSPTASAVTDNNGRYTLEAVLGSWTVQFSTSAGFVTYWGGTTPEEATDVTIVGAATTVDNIDVQLSAGGFVGTVSTGTGGRSGLTVRAVAPSGMSFGSVTGSGGTFAIENLPAGTYTVFVSSPDSTGDVEVGGYPTSATAATTGIVLDLPSGSVSALVRRNDEPATDQFLTATLVETSGIGRRQAPVIDGSVDFGYLPDGDYRLSVTDLRLGATTFHPSAPDEAGASIISVQSGAAVSGVIVTLPDTVTATGTVTSAGAPVPGTTVTAFSTERAVAVSTATLDDGTFALALPAGTFRVTFQPPAGPNYPAAIAGLEGDFTVTVVDRNTSLDELDIDLPDASVSGSFADGGSPLGNAALTLTRLSPSPTFDVHISTSGDGAFTFNHLPDGTYEITGRPADRVTSSVIGHVTVAGGADKTLQLEFPDGSIAGTIFQDGLPVDGGSGQVTLTPVSVGRERTAPVAADGSYLFDNVLDGDYTLSTLDPATSERRWHPASSTAAGATTVSVVNQAALENVDVTLSPTVGSITGSVTGPDGRAVAGVTVDVFSDTDGETPTSTTTTASDGTFRVERVKAGNHRVRFGAPSLALLDEWWRASGHAYTVDRAELVGVIAGVDTTGIDATLEFASTLELAIGDATPRPGTVFSLCPGAFAPVNNSCPGDGASEATSTTMQALETSVVIGGLTPGTYTATAFDADPSTAIAQPVTVTLDPNSNAACLLALLESGVSECANSFADVDGVSDAVEDGAPNSGDGNGDGVADADQPDVASLIDPALADAAGQGSNYVSISSSQTGSTEPTVLRDVRIEQPPAENPPPAGSTPQSSLIGFRVTNLAQGATPAVVRIEVFLPSRADAYVKYDEVTGTWTDATSLAQFDTAPTSIGGLDRWRVVLTITDGGFGDADGIVNGAIADPGLFALKDPVPPPPPPPPAPPPPPPPGGGGAAAPAVSIVPVVPARLFDTRPAATVDGLQANMGRRAGGTTSEVQVTGRGNVPADAIAANVNVVAIGPGAAGFLTLYPCGSARPEASTLNFAAGQTIANGATIKVGAGGTICVYSDQATDLIVDVTGYVPAGSTVGTVLPARLHDTRPAGTVDGNEANTGRRTPGSTTTVQVAGRGGVPADATAATVNVVAVNPGAAGFFTIYPCGSARPEASTLNFAAGQTVANGATIKLGTGGTICVYTDQATDLLLDVTGYVPATSNLGTVVPARLFDSRPAATVDGAQSNAGRRTAGSTTEVVVGGRGNVPATASGAVVNVVAVGAGAPGFLTLYPCGSARPEASTLNFAAGQTVANGATIKLGTGGTICVYTDQATDLLLDVTGFIPAA